MTDTTQNGGSSPLDEDKTPNTHDSSEYSPDFYKKIAESALPFFSAKKPRMMDLVDAEYNVLSNLKHQLEFSKGLLSGSSNRDSVDIPVDSIEGFIDNLRVQVLLLETSFSEILVCVQNNDHLLREKIARYEAQSDETETLMRIIDRLKAENRELKGVKA